MQPKVGGVTSIAINSAHLVSSDVTIICISNQTYYYDILKAVIIVVYVFLICCTFLLIIETAQAYQKACYSEAYFIMPLITQMISSRNHAI